MNPHACLLSEFCGIYLSRQVISVQKQLLHKFGGGGGVSTWMFDDDVGITYLCIVVIL